MTSAKFDSEKVDQDWIFYFKDIQVSQKKRYGN
jgi:hypothetical protein